MDFTKPRMVVKPGNLCAMGYRVEKIIPLEKLPSIMQLPIPAPCMHWQKIPFRHCTNQSMGVIVGKFYCKKILLHNADLTIPGCAFLHRMKINCTPLVLPLWNRMMVVKHLTVTELTNREAITTISGSTLPMRRELWWPMMVV